MGWTQVTGGVIAEGLRAACVAGAVILCVLTHSPLSFLPTLLSSIPSIYQLLSSNWPRIA